MIATSYHTSKHSACYLLAAVVVVRVESALGRVGALAVVFLAAESAAAGLLAGVLLATAVEAGAFF